MTIMHHGPYQAVVEYDDEAGLFHGEIVNLRDVITFQGRSVDELKQALAESIDDYVAFCRARGEEPEEPFPGISWCAWIPVRTKRLRARRSVPGSAWRPGWRARSMQRRPDRWRAGHGRRIA